jgi:hypothetical protein
MGPFLRGFCSELTKTADTEAAQPGYGYSPGGDKPRPSQGYGTVQQADVGQKSKPFFIRQDKEPWRPSPKPPAPIDNRAPVDPYPKAKAKKPSMSKVTKREGFPAFGRQDSPAPERKFTENIVDKINSETPAQHQARMIKERNKEGHWSFKGDVWIPGRDDDPPAPKQTAGDRERAQRLKDLSGPPQFARMPSKEK